MCSVMSKSLVLSQGINKSTFIWTWLCIVTDFLGIFFTCTWVFYSNDDIHGDFLGYFNIFGEIWFWKFAISTLVPCALATIVYFLAVVPVLFFGILFTTGHGSGTNQCDKCGYSILWLIFCMNEFLYSYYIVC